MVFVAGNTGDTDSDGNDDDYEDGSDDGAVEMSVATAISGIDREPCYSRITLLRDLHSCYTYMMRMVVVIVFLKRERGCLFVT